MAELTPKQTHVLKLMMGVGREWQTPTEIGLNAGKDYDSASAWASGALKGLLRRGLVETRGSGQWCLTAAGGEEAADAWGFEPPDPADELTYEDGTWE